MEPVLGLTPLQRGEFQETSSDPQGVLCLSDAGAALWHALAGTDGPLQCRLSRYGPGPSEWEILLFGQTLTATLRLTRYRKGLTVRPAPAHTVSVEASGPLAVVCRWLRAAAASRNASPLYEMSDWREFAERFGLAQGDALAAWNQMIAEDPAARVGREVEEAEALHAQAKRERLPCAEIEAHIRPMGEALRDGNLDLALSYAEMVRRGIADIKERERERRQMVENAREFLQRAKDYLQRAKEAGIRSERAAELLQIGQALLYEEEDFEGAVNYANMAVAAVEQAGEAHQKAFQHIESSRSLIEEGRNLGLDVTWALDIFGKAQEACGNGDHAAVEHHARTIRSALEKAKNERQVHADRRQAAEYSLNFYRTVLADARRSGADITEAEALLSKAEEAMGKGQFAAVIELSARVKDVAEKGVKTHQSAHRAIEEAEAAYREAASFADVAEAEKLIGSAKAALGKKDYATAIDYATQARVDAERALKEGEPKVRLEFGKAALKAGLWNRCPVNIINAGKAHARRVAVRLGGPVEVMRLPLLPTLKAGERKTFELGLKPRDAGELPLDISASCVRARDGVEFHAAEVKWLEVEGPKAGEPAGEEVRGYTTVEDLFLIYGDGRLLARATRRATAGIDDDILTGMLAAVQNFIHDSFGGLEGGLGRLEYGKMTILIEHGKTVYIAAVLSGTEPPDLRNGMKVVISEVEVRYAGVLDNWDGKPLETAELEGVLKRLMVPETSEAQK